MKKIFLFFFVSFLFLVLSCNIPPINGNTNNGKVSPIPLTANEWKVGEITDSEGEVWFCFDATKDVKYYIWWDDKKEGTGSFSCDVEVCGYREDMESEYYTFQYYESDNGYDSYKYIVAAETELVYLKVTGLNPTDTGTFAIMYLHDSTVSNLTVTPKISSLVSADTTALTASILPSQTSQSVIWTSNNASVASVDSKGVVTAKMPGTATIIATSRDDSTKYDSCTVTVLADQLGDNTWKTGEIPDNNGIIDEAWYYFDATAGQEYLIYGDVSTINVDIAAYREDLSTPYFYDWDGEWKKTLTAAATERVYIKVQGKYLSSHGAYAIKYTLPPAKKNTWTIMVYSDADNNLESALLNDIEEMKSGMNDEVNLIVLIDRIYGYSSDTTTLGENFSSTRLYRVIKNEIYRISGGTEFPQITQTSNYEANMGDATTLKKFITFCKANYPASHYALIFSNHGGGARNKATQQFVNLQKSICYDDSSANDCMYSAEITDVLTPAESVDLIGYDACIMGEVEVAYQYRSDNGDFNAKIMVASAPNEWGNGWDYESFLARISAVGGNNGESDITVGGSELFYNPSTMTAAELGAIIVEEQRDSVEAASLDNQSLSVFDLSVVDTLKTKIDELSVLLKNENEKIDFENIRGSDSTPGTMHYFSAATQTDWISNPYFDIYDLCDRISGSSSFSTAIQTKASEIKTAVEAVVLYSYGGSDYSGFTDGQNGIGLFCSDGDRLYSSYRHWVYEWWYNSIDTNVWWPGGHYYGQLSWCIDGLDASTDTVGNWFELQDAWFDVSNGSDGGGNGYQW